MKDQSIQHGNSAYHQQLRRKAEEISRQSPAQLNRMSPSQVSELIHDLQVHQIELELQYQELRITEEQLRESFDRYQSLYNNAPVGYFTIDKEGIIHEVNKTFTELFRQLPEVSINKPFADLIAAQDRKVFYIFMRQAFQHKTFPHLELQLQRPDGSCFYGFIQANWETEPDTNQYARMTVMDITGRKKAEIASKKAKEEWESTFNAVSDAVLLIDLQLKVLRANPATELVTGVPLEGILGTTCHELFHGSGDVCDGCPLTSSGGSVCQCSGEVEHHKLGKTFQVSISQFLDKDGREQGYVCIAKDITDKKKIEEELEQARKMEAIGTLAGGIAHDFNNILAAIIGFSEFSLKQIENKDFSELKANSQAILKSGLRARDLVRQILTFSRKTTIKKDRLLLGPLLKESLQLLRPTIPSSVEIVANVVSEDIAVRVAPEQIQQLLINLVSNAEYAMRPGGGSVTVTLESVRFDTEVCIASQLLEAGPYAKLTVCDTGCGMDTYIHRRATEPFFTTKGVGEGSGMGLSIVHGIVENIGGALEISSRRNKGTTVSVLLPVVLDTPVVAEPEVVEGGRSHSQSKRVLFVDDEEMLISLGVRILDFLGHQVTTCSSGLEALALYKKNPQNFDLVITDQTMPVLPGSEFSKKLLEISPTLPIILCTGYSSTIDKEKAKEIGIRSFIMKPVNIETLSKAIQEIFPE